MRAGEASVVKLVREVQSPTNGASNNNLVNNNSGVVEKFLDEKGEGGGGKGRSHTR